MNKLLSICVALFVCACSKPEPRNRVVEAVRFIQPDVVCQPESSTPVLDTAWCRTPDKSVLFCKQGVDTMLECKPYGTPKAPPAAPPSGSPILPETPK